MITAALGFLACKDIESAGMSSKKEITEFKLDGHKGEINYSDNTIVVVVPDDLAITGLTAEVQHTGVSISPDPAAARDYTDAVAFTVTAQDGSTAAYTVSVQP
ncbi:MAG: DUF5018 domain-containing protein, partial [Spirochaetaceae bacterium]|nr:DUF5018 domain-containing protein [Spirochaetaceae bacterium]